MATAYRSRLDDERQRLEELARRTADPADPATITYEEFLEWTDEDTHAEWVMNMYLSIGRRILLCNTWLRALSDDASRRMN